jgi:hypothetical protein
MVDLAVVEEILILFPADKMMVRVKVAQTLFLVEVRMAKAVQALAITVEL